MENVSTDITEIISFLSEFSIEADDNPNLTDVKEIEDISLPLAHAIKYEYALLTPKGEQALRETYAFLVETAEKLHLDDLVDILYVEEPITPRKMTITINNNGTFE